MEVKKLLTKSLLVMAGLCVGANASWAQNWGDPLVTYNFENSETYTTDWPTANTGNKNEVKQGERTKADATTSHYYVSRDTNGGNRITTHTISNSSFLAASQWKIEFDFAMYGSSVESSYLKIISGSTTLFQLRGAYDWGGTTGQIQKGDGTKIGEFTCDGYASATRGSVCLNNWYHAVIIGDGTNVTALVTQDDGTLVLTTTTVADFAIPTKIEMQAHTAFGQVGIDDVKFYKATNPLVTIHYQLSDETTLIDDVETEVISGNSFTPSYPASFRSGTTQYTYASGGDEIASVTSDTEVTIVYNSTAMPVGTFYAETYEKNGGTTGWSTSNGSDHAPVIITNGTNKYLTCENLYHNARTVTGNVVNQVVDKNTDFTMTFDLQLKSQTSDNTCALTFNDYDNALSMLRFLGSPNSTTWTINDNVDQTVTLTTETWYTVSYSRKGSLTYLTITPTAGGDAVFAQNTISTLSTDGGLGNITFTTGRHYSNFALDNVLVRAWQSGDTPEVTETTYTIKYQDSEGTTLKDDVVNATTVGTEDIVASTGELASFYNDGRTKKYIYQSGNTPITAVANAASNVITLVFREAATYNYTVTTNQGTVLANTSDFEAEKIYQPYPRYDLKNGVMYEKGAISNEYRQQFNLTENNQVVLVDGYSNSGISNVVYYTEGENIEGVSVTTDGTISTRSSNAAAGLRNDADRTIYSNLVPGKYKIFVAYNRTSGTASNTFTVDGQDIVLSVSSGSNMVTTNSDEITVSSTSDVVWTDGTSALDYIYIQKTGETAEITSAGWATLYTDYALDFSGVTGLTAYTAAYADGVVTLTEVTTVPAGTGVVLKGAAKDYSIPVIASSETAQGSLTGSTSVALTYDADAENDYFMLALNDEDEAQFTKLTSGSIEAGKAYLVLAKGSYAKLRVIFAGDASGIEEIATEGAEDGVLYNVAGQVVTADYKGIVIKNGKKYLNQ